MRLHTIEDIRREVSATALNKAIAYQRQRRASVTEMNNDGSLIEGRVQGTRSRPYAVTVRLRPVVKDTIRIDGACSCPVGFNCKHVAALLLESMATSHGRTLAASATPSMLPAQTSLAR